MNKLFTFILFILFSVTAMAQREGEPHRNRAEEQNRMQNKEKMRAQKRIFMKSELGLTETEFVAFTLILDEYEKNIDDSKATQRTARHGLTKDSSDQEYEKALQIIREEEVKQCKLSETFYSDLSEILSLKKIYLYYEAENNFNRLLLKGIRENVPRQE